MPIKKKKRLFTGVCIALAALIAFISFKPYQTTLTIRLSSELEEGDSIDSVTYVSGDTRTEILPVYDENNRAVYTVTIPTRDYDQDSIEVVSQGKHIDSIVSFGMKSRRGISYSDLHNRAEKSAADDSRRLTVYVTAFFEWVAAVVTIYTTFLHVIGISIIAVLALLWLWMMNVLEREETSRPEHTYASVIWRVALTVMIFLASIVSAALYIMRHNYGEITIEELVYTLSSNMDGTNWSQFSVYIPQAVVALSLGTVISIAVNVLLSRQRKQLKEEGADIRKGVRRTEWIHLIVLFGSLAVVGICVLIFWRDYEVFTYIMNQQENSTIYDEEYVDPATLTLTFPEEKKNLIYIYLESMEITNSDVDDGGGEPFNAIPNMTALAEEYDDFSGDEPELNGAYPLKTNGWTIAGMVAQTAGIGLKLPVESNSNTVDNVLPGVTNIGDILEENGYHNVIMMGSDAMFADRGNYFSKHGNYDILDLNWARDTGRLPEEYHVFWGFEDQKLFQFAKEEVEELAAEGGPFNFTMLTEDTHFPAGYRCEDCGDTYGNYEDVVACSDTRVGDFISWIMEQDFAEDTVIVLSGDHKFMNNAFFDDIVEGYSRRTYVCIINSRKEETSAYRTYSTQDLFPTTLSALGVDIPGNRLGLGTDLYSDTPTLLERRSRSEVNTELAMNSTYYNEHFLYP